MAIPPVVSPQAVRMAIACGLVAVATLARLLPHPPNCTPLGALALFGGAVFGTRAAAYAVPLAAMLLSDLLLQACRGDALHAGMPVVYGCFAATVWLGRRLGPRAEASALAAASAAAVLLFFVATNQAWWAAGQGYPRDGQGLLACFTAALPFLGWSALAQGGFGLLLFGGQRWLERQFAVVPGSLAAAEGS